MRFEYDFARIITNFFSNIFIKFKPFTVHLEAIMVDEVWEEVKKRCLSNKVYKWYIMTPANYDYFVSSFGITQSKKEISEIMKKRYKWMIEHNQKLELHIHLAITEDMPYLQQEKLFQESILWLKKELGIVPKEFVAGWWAYNEDTLKIAKKLKLKHIKYSDYNSTHDYHWILKNRKR